jgi:copper ion binding protein
MRFIRPFLDGLLALVLAFPAGSALAAERQGTTVKVRVDGLACPFCAYGLEKKLKRIEGVTGLEIQLDEGLAIVHFDEDARVDEDLLAEKVREAGFTPRGITIAAADPAARAPAAGEEEARAELVLEGMRCELCSANITASLQEVPGVTSVSVDFESKAATVLYDPARTDPQALIQAVQAAGDFRATLKE